MFISSSRRFARIPRTQPSSLMTAVAVVLSQMSAPSFAASFATADRRTDLLPFLDQQGTAAAGRRIPRGHGAGRTGTDHDDVVLVGGHSRDHSSATDISECR